ncbi:hypothetical protein FEM33_14035 [Dyadobacter flavalbus]|uniref:Uncharacterized protein n=1 Tax=Dyadobacter flavalbus TaxID=2579942 RepID=A0A5M8QXH3_9BACT|nr:hypothetical protein [Dyadobacter flavalbus]KAA6439376.1 hypothetical protein FEM33_14035 [Dyadobacter flavalbus]
MRRIIPIFLFVLLLYNMVGYSIVYLLEDRQTVSAMGKDFIQQSTGSQDIVIRMPVAVPYQNNWEFPQPAEGQIVHEGKFYQLKSKQLINDTLLVVCEYDQYARERFYDLVSRINDQVSDDYTGSEQGSRSVILKNFLKEYMNHGCKHVVYVLEWFENTRIVFPSLFLVLPEIPAAIPFPPPDLF